MPAKDITTWSVANSVWVRQLRFAEHFPILDGGAIVKKHLQYAVAAGALLVLDACGGTAANKPTNVSPRQVPNHFVVAAPGNAASGTRFTFPVTAVDGAGNVVSSYTGVAHFTSTDSLAALPPDSGITNGMGTFSATLATVGTQKITATDVSTALTGTSSAIDVLTTGTFVITSGQPPNGLVGESYGGFEQICVTGMIEGFQLEAVATGGEHTDRGGAVVVWSSSPLPPGLQISSITFGGPPICPHGIVTVIDGRPTQVGTYTFTLTASNTLESASATYTITIANPTNE